MPTDSHSPFLLKMDPIQLAGLPVFLKLGNTPLRSISVRTCSESVIPLPWMAISTAISRAIESGLGFASAAAFMP